MHSDNGTAKLQYWCGNWNENGWKAAPVLEVHRRAPAKKMQIGT